MDVKPLLDLTCALVASFLTGKNKEEIKEGFGCEGVVFSEEEERVVREENRWCE